MATKSVYCSSSPSHVTTSVRLLLSLYGKWNVEQCIAVCFIHHVVLWLDRCIILIDSMYLDNVQLVTSRPPLPRRHFVSSINQCHVTTDRRVVAVFVWT